MLQRSSAGPIAVAMTALSVACVLLGACGKRAARELVDASCSVSAPTSCPDPAPRYADVETIFAQRCVPCHFGLPEGPWPLTSYQDISDWQDIVRASVLDCTMPPPEAQLPMTDDERQVVLTWALCGFQK